MSKWIAPCGCKINLVNVRETERGIEIGDITMIKHCKGEWISVKDRLPDIAGYYYATNKKTPGRPLVYLWVFDSWRRYTQLSPDGPVLISNITDVTHWMPLPDPPEVE